MVQGTCTINYFNQPFPKAKQNRGCFTGWTNFPIRGKEFPLAVFGQPIFPLSSTLGCPVHEERGKTTLVLGAWHGHTVARVRLRASPKLDRPIHESLNQPILQKREARLGSEGRAINMTISPSTIFQHLEH